MNNKSKDQLEALKLIETVSKNVVRSNQDELVNLNVSFTIPHMYVNELDVELERFYLQFVKQKGLND